MRREGKSYAHPLVVLVVAPNGLEQVRVGVAAGRRLGKAVQRNRAKRRLREIMRPLLPALKPGYDVMLIARPPMATAEFETIRQAVIALLHRASLLTTSTDGTLPTAPS